MFGRRKKRKEVTKAAAVRIMAEFFILFWVMIIVLWENTVGFYVRVFLLNVFFICYYFLIEYWNSVRFRNFRAKLRNLMTNKNESVQ